MDVVFFQHSSNLSVNQGLTTDKFCLFLSQKVRDVEKKQHAKTIYHLIRPNNECLDFRKLQPYKVLRHG